MIPFWYHNGIMAINNTTVELLNVLNDWRSNVLAVCPSCMGSIILKQDAINGYCSTCGECKYPKLADKPEIDDTPAPSSGAGSLYDAPPRFGGLTMSTTGTVSTSFQNMMLTDAQRANQRAISAANRAKRRSNKDQSIGIGWQDIPF